MQDPPRRKILPDAPSKSTHYTQGEHMIMNTNRYNFRIRVLLKITTGGLMYKLPHSNPQYNRHNILAHNLRQVHESHTTHIRLRKLGNHRPQRLDKRIEETSGLHTRR